MAISFVDCRDDHLSSLHAFFARAYRPDYKLRVSETLFRWQFRETPDSEGNVYHLRLALNDGEIAGCLGYIPVETNLGSRVVRGAWVINWMIDPNQRRLGLGPFLMREVTRQFEVTLNVGPNRDARDLLSRMGWTDYGELSRYVYVLDAQAAGALTENGKLEWPARASPAERKSSQDVAVTLVDRFDDDATELWDGSLATEGASTGGTRRSAKFLNWRYADHPQFNYRLFEARDKGGLAGLAVYRVEQVHELPVRVGHLVELISEAGRRFDGEGILLQSVFDDARVQGVAAIDFFCASRRFSASLARCGFLSGEDPAIAQIPILFQPLDRRRAGIPFMAYLGNIPEGTEVQDWYVTKGDGDQDRPN